MNSQTNTEIEKRFTAYLKSVVINARNDYLRKLIHREQNEYPAGEIPDKPDQGELDIDDMLLIRMTLQRQPAIRARILYFSCFCGYRAEEIARMLQCSVGFVNRQKRKAILTLREALKGGMGDA